MSEPKRRGRPKKQTVVGDAEASIESSEKSEKKSKSPKKIERREKKSKSPETIEHREKNERLPREKTERPSPSAHARKYDTGMKKKGNDGKLWIVVESKNGAKRWKHAAKGRPERKRPTNSATDFDVGTRRKGGDGNMWRVVAAGETKRWKKIN